MSILRAVANTHRVDDGEDGGGGQWCCDGNARSVEVDEKNARWTGCMMGGDNLTIM